MCVPAAQILGNVIKLAAESVVDRQDIALVIG